MDQAESLAFNAELAAKQGKSVFTPDLVASTPTDFGELIEAVEGQGWRLEQWAVLPPSDGATLYAYPMFRRV